jgi:hypothetical protein
MRLYHSRLRDTLRIVSIICWLLLAAGCTAPQATQALISITIVTGDQETKVQIPAGSTVQQALGVAGLEPGALDRTEPPDYAVLTDGTSIRLVRVTEQLEVQREVIPFEQQIVHNESLAIDQKILLQKGQNGLNEITYHHVYEDGKELPGSSLPVKTVRLQDPVPEITMIGIQAPIRPMAIPGRLVYLRDGNAWLIEQTTGNRRAVVTSRDLDGRVFSLSSDGTWLLFTRRSEEEGQINQLWAADITAENGTMIDLKVANVVHFADWVPGWNSKIAFSTVEPRSAAPGWQANNDLNALSFSTSGWVSSWDVVLEPNFGGLYGWWGMDFLWEQKGERLAFSRPDGIGVIEFESGEMIFSGEVIPLQTRGDWAWIPGITWGPDGENLFSVDHIPPPGSTIPEESQDFGLKAFSMDASSAFEIVPRAGMFAYPLASPLQAEENEASAYQIAFLQALMAEQSETSHYQVVIMDRDGSNRRVIFPAEGSLGLSPQRNWGVWSPAPMPDSDNHSIALIYQKNLWIVDTSNGQAQQITGDGLTSRVVWK